MRSFFLRRSSLALLAMLSMFASVAGAKDRLHLREVSLELPGAPAIVVAADVNGDSRKDLVIAVAFTEWDQIGIEEYTEMDDVDGFVEVLTIVPALFDRRELWVVLAQDDGSYRPLPPVTLEPSVLTLEAGPADAPVVALTDRGFEALRLDSDDTISFELLVEMPPILAGTGALIPDLDLVRDLEGDGRLELMVPVVGQILVFEAGKAALVAEPKLRIPLPQWDSDHFSATSFDYVLPETRDLDGDGLSDVIFAHPREGWDDPRVRLRDSNGLGSLIAPLSDWQLSESESEPEDQNDPPAVVYIGDLDGDGHAEVVGQTDTGEGDAGFRQEMKEAKEPPQRFSFYRTETGMRVAPEAYSELSAVGFAFDSGQDLRLPGGFQDLDGDGRLDLVLITLDFSMMQAVRVMATRRISVGMDFHVYCQSDDGRFAPVRDLDLSGKFKLDLDNLRIGQLSQFAGDFDGDGRSDFMQIGRGRQVTIHLGQDGCRYPRQADLSLQLRQEPRDLSLVAVRDIDDDHLADLMVIQPRKSSDPEETSPVRLDLYLSSER